MHTLQYFTETKCSKNKKRKGKVFKFEASEIIGMINNIQNFEVNLDERSSNA